MKKPALPPGRGSKWKVQKAVTAAIRSIPARVAHKKIIAPLVAEVSGHLRYAKRRPA